MRNLVLILLSIFYLSSNAFAETIAELFEESFNTMYTNGECRQNIHALVEEASRRGINLDNAIIMEIRDNYQVGFHMYDARDMLYMADVPGGPRVRSSGKSGLQFYHVVLVEDGMVYDFDYTQKATPIEINEYFKKQIFYKPDLDPYKALHEYGGRLYLDFKSAKNQNLKAKAFLYEYLSDVFPKVDPVTYRYTMSGPTKLPISDYKPGDVDALICRSLFL